MADLLKRLHRACPEACGFWRIEWKARKSGLHVGKLFPHFHLLVWKLPQRLLGIDPEDNVPDLQSFVMVRDCQQSFAGLCSKVIKRHVFESESQGSRFVDRKLHHEIRSKYYPESDVRHWMSFFDWVSLAWYHVVDSHNVDHFLAGCRVEKIRSWGGVVSYCAKYMTKADSENFLQDVATGRNWGIFNRAAMPWARMIELPLGDDEGVRLRRIMRRYLEQKTGRQIKRHFGMTLYCDPSQFVRSLARGPAPPF
jgi:hypothetical protein